MKNNFSEVNGFEIYQRIELLIHKRSTVKKDFYKDVGITRQNLARWKSGSLPSADVIIKISEFFHVSTYWLLTGKDFESKYIEKQSFKEALLSELEIIKQTIESF